jgi:hypothetical protein
MICLIAALGGTTANSGNFTTVNATSINAATYSVGTTFTANATLVNAAAVNITGQVNTATLFATTSANVGANNQLTTTALVFTGNTTTAPTLTIASNSSAGITYGNSSITGAPSILLQNSTSQTNVFSNGIYVGTSSINSTSISGNGSNITSVNATQLGGTAAASYQLNSTLSANITSYLTAPAAIGGTTANTGNFTTINAATHSVGTSFVANTIQVTIAGIPLSANGSTGTAGFVLTSNGTTGAPYWQSTSGFGLTGAQIAANNWNFTSTSGVNAYAFSAGTTLGAQGEIRATNNITAYYSSDIRLKTNITPIANALFKLNTVSGVEFDWTEDHIKAAGGEDGYFVRKHDVGVIAQEIQKILPEAVGERGDGILAVKYERIVPLLIEAIKELKVVIDDLKEKIDGSSS